MSDKRICRLVGIVTFSTGCYLVVVVTAMEGAQLALACLSGLFMGFGGAMVLSPIRR